MSVLQELFILRRSFNLAIFRNRCLLAVRVVVVEGRIRGVATSFLEGGWASRTRSHYDSPTGIHLRCQGLVPAGSGSGCCSGPYPVVAASFYPSLRAGVVGRRETDPDGPDRRVQAGVVFRVVGCPC